MGARSSTLQTTENAEGERFKFANNYWPEQEQWHVSNEGHNSRDERGTHS